MRLVSRRLATPGLEGDVMRGRADRHYGKQNASILDNNHLTAEYGKNFDNGIIHNPSRRS